ncbi:MAG: acetate/propionate family kinase [Liquorilactobacillus nagelii]|jgi:acetate kinase|uniref:acetate/propionate family kinase n=1 Tax=Liquorilactobacillus nagelii TaxID=82688 RepID=UPI00242BF25F|nr:acetate/propionate family kinase [Liquorilactobacillus nagelii]MCI1922042.1 acetate/propionate family kinase [Liquorilactobacillus nagelii]MCI1977429.1 acetate/propionate family kinase [Liquorilactobacillus nagelii]
MKKILSINSGSSSLKISLFSLPQQERLAKIMVDYSDEANQLVTIKLPHQVLIKQHYAEQLTPVELALKLLKKYKVIDVPEEIAAIGHRIVAGGELFHCSTEITPTMMSKLESINELAPLHNPANVAGIRDAQKLLPNCPQIAVFDTTFHTDLPPENFLYALPMEYYRKYKIRKYGAHGTSHRFVAQRASVMLQRPLKDLNLITLHLGSGASITAIKNGRSFDTSMGFSPLTGLMMSTRCGDVDPSALVYLLQHHAFSDMDECLKILNQRSGLLGVSGVSRDMREVEREAEFNPQAELAIKMFIKKICDYIGSYWLELGGADALVFTGGIGENDSQLRKMVSERLKCLGINFQVEQNQSHELPFDFSTSDSQAHLLVIPTDEELMIAQDAYNLIVAKQLAIKTNIH